MLNRSNQWQALQPDWLSLHHEAKMPEREAMISDLNILRSRRILDIGCGVGNFTGLLAKYAPNHEEVIGVDLSITNLSRATLLVSEEERRITFIRCDANHLPFVHHSFDFIWCANTLQYFQDPVNTLKYFAQYLSPEGKLVVKDEDVIRDILLSWDSNFELAIINAWSKIVEELEGAFWDPYTGRKLLQYFVDSGFKDIRVKTYLIERCGKLPASTAMYIYRAFWGYKDYYQKYLSVDQWGLFRSYFDIHSKDSIFNSEKMHFISTETVVSATYEGV
jgi:ubiquinone/menaquinone biosynthesis C-methylase UbiE